MADLIVTALPEAIIRTVLSRVFSPVLSLLKSRLLERLRILEVEVKFIGDLRGKFEEEVDEAKTRGEIISEYVVDAWLKHFDAINKKMEELQRSEDIQSLGFLCPNLVRRYQLNRRIDRMLKDLAHFTVEFNFTFWPEELPLPCIDESNDHANFDSGTLFRRVMEALKDSEVDMIGVCGREVKKLKMMAKVVQQVGREGLFDMVVPIEVPHDSSTWAIQSNLARTLDLKLVKKPEVGRAVQLWCTLSNGKRNLIILIILDGLSKELNLRNIGIPIPDGNRGCKILLISQNLGLLKNMQGDTDYQIEKLLDDDACILVKKAMGNSVSSLELRDDGVKTHQSFS